MRTGRIERSGATDTPLEFSLSVKSPSFSVCAPSIVNVTEQRNWTNDPSLKRNDFKYTGSRLLLRTSFMFTDKLQSQMNFKIL
jgi:hypothetical protein